MKTEKAFREFMNSRISANLRPKSIEWYEDRLGPFVKSCPIMPRSPESIENYLAKAPGSDETKRDTYNALRTFYKFISQRHRIPNPLAFIPPPRRSKAHMPTLEADELLRLFQAAENLVDQAIVTLIIDTGIRVGELCSLVKHNIKSGTIVVFGKTGWREVPVSIETKDLLGQLAQQSEDDFVFHDSEGKPASKYCIYRLVRRMMERAGIKGPKLGPHRIRHAFAKNFLMQGGDLKSLQEILGHTDMKTTQKYTSLNLNDIIKKHQSYSPLKAVMGAELSDLITPEILRQAEEIVRAKMIYAKGAQNQCAKNNPNIKGGTCDNRTG